MIFVYNVLILCILIIAFPLYLPRILHSPGRRDTFRQRMGMSGLPEPSEKKTGKKRIWIHALSVGEVISAIPLVKGLGDFQDMEIVFSASTKTGFETAENRLGQDVSLLFYFPYDLIFSVKRIVRQADADLLIIVETDIWPNFLYEIRRQKIPALLINTRLSDKSFAAYRKLLFFAQTLFQTFARICPQSEADAQRFQQLGVSPERISLNGNMKFDQAQAKADACFLRQMQSRFRLEGKKVWIAGSTHEGEESIIAEIWRELKEIFPSLFLILVPRNPARAEDVCRLFTQKHFRTVTMAESEKDPSLIPDIMVVDRIGVLNDLYALSDLAFVGGSLLPCGGHNPLEAAACGKPVIFGPHMSDFAEISQMLLQSRAAVRVKDGDSLLHAVSAFLGDEKYARECGKQGEKVCSENRGGTARNIAVIRSYL